MRVWQVVRPVLTLPPCSSGARGCTAAAQAGARTAAIGWRESGGGRRAISFFSGKQFRHPPALEPGFPYRTADILRLPLGHFCPPRRPGRSELLTPAVSEA